jgi:sulfur carrier protein ThiS
MIVYLRSGGKLRDVLAPDVDRYTRKVEVAAGLSIQQILAILGIAPAMVAFAFADGKVKKLDYVPADGETVTLQSPVAGG